MYEKYIIEKESAKNIVENGIVTGFTINAKVPYYRGLGISMIEDIQITVDGNLVPSETITIEIHGNSYTLKQMETEPDDRWEFGEIGTVKVAKPGGLSAGEHNIELLFNLRISYLPGNALRKDIKTIVI